MFDRKIFDRGSKNLRITRELRSQGSPSGREWEGRVGRGRKIGINADVNVWRDEGREKEGTREGDDGGRVICVTGTTRAPRLSRPPASLSGALLAGVEPSRGRVPSPQPLTFSVTYPFSFYYLPLSGVPLAVHRNRISLAGPCLSFESRFLPPPWIVHHLFFSPSPSFYTFFPHLCSFELVLGE